MHWLTMFLLNCVFWFLKCLFLGHRGGVGDMCLEEGYECQKVLKGAHGF